MSAIECGICFLEYDEEELTPRILSCGHTICQQCVIRLSEDDQCITCPFDRRVTLLDGNEGVNSLPKNFALLDLCGKEKQEQENKSGKKADVPCFENPSHEAVLYCQQCEVELCDSCFKSVHKSKSLSAHQEIKIFGKPIKLPKCPKHPHNIAEFFCTDPECTDISKIMCQTCVLFDQHKSHKHDALMKILLKNEQRLKQLLIRNEKLLRDQEKCIQANEDELKCCEVTGAVFKNVAKSISDQFDMMKKEALRELTQFASDMEDKKKGINIRLNEVYNEMMELHELIEKRLKMKNDLHNTDETKIWETFYKSGSHDKSDGFLDYVFSVPEIKLTRKMRITVKTPTWKNIELDIESGDECGTIKKMIEVKEGTPAGAQRLIFVGKQLEDHNTAADYKIIGGSVIHMGLRLRGD